MFPCLLPASVCARYRSAFGCEWNRLHLLRIEGSFALRAVGHLYVAGNRKSSSAMPRARGRAAPDHDFLQADQTELWQAVARMALDGDLLGLRFAIVVVLGNLRPVSRPKLCADVCAAAAGPDATSVIRSDRIVGSRLLRFARNDSSGTGHCEERSDEAILRKFGARPQIVKRGSGR
jgi:hypothetical protein